MNLIKLGIQNQFNRAALSYDQVAFVQQKCAKFLVSNLIKKATTNKINTILDLGTGTGYVATLLSKEYPDSTIDLNDISSEMLTVAAKKINNKNKVILGDLEEFNFTEYDLITSNLSFQWINNLSTIIAKFHKKARFFAFSCLLAGTFQEWLKNFTNLKMQFPLNNYPNEPALQKILLTLHPENYWTAIKSYKLEFDTPKLFRNYLHNLGASLNHYKIPYNELKKVMILNNPVKVTYKVFFAIIHNSFRGEI